MTRHERTLILGWAGSRPRQLGPIRRFYERRGNDVRVLLPDVPRNMFLSSGWRAQAREVVPWLGRGGASTTVHLFSNGGFFLLAAILEQLGPGKEWARAFVMDSAPGFSPEIEPSLVREHAAMALMPTVLTALGRRPSLKHPVLTPALELTFRAWLANGRPLEGMFEAYEETVRGARGVPHLLLYGGADPLVYPRFVEAYASRLEQAGTLARTRFFRDGEHVRLLFQHRHAYLAEVERHLDGQPPMDDVAART